MSTPPPDAHAIARCKKLLLKKGAELNERLTRLLAVEKSGLEAALPSAKAGATPVEKLRRFMALVEEQLARIRAGSYGTCATCGDGLPYRELAEVPWIDTCQACARRAATDGEETSS